VSQLLGKIAEDLAFETSEEGRTRLGNKLLKITNLVETSPRDALNGLNVLLQKGEPRTQDQSLDLDLLAMRLKYAMDSCPCELCTMHDQDDA
jgi:hypothetical protein